MWYGGQWCKCLLRRGSSLLLLPFLLELPQPLLVQLLLLEARVVARLESRLVLVADCCEDIRQRVERPAEGRQHRDVV